MDSTLTDHGEVQDVVAEWKEKKEDVRVLILGDKDVGKSSLWWTYLDGEFPDPEKVSRYTKNKMNVQEIMFGDVTYNLIFTEDDTSGGNSESETLSEQLNSTDVCVILFSTIDHRSFQNMKYKWCNVVRENNEDIPLVFVANKCDLREEAATIPGLAPVTTEEGEQAVLDSEANGYAEISVKNKEGLRELLRTIVDGVLDGRNKKFEKEKLEKEKRNNCLIM